MNGQPCPTCGNITNKHGKHLNSVDLPEKGGAGGRPPGHLPPKPKQIEQAMFILMTYRNQWFLIDEWPTKSSKSGNSALGISLWRRGAEVRHRHIKGVNYEYARWTHPVPTDIPA